MAHVSPPTTPNRRIPSKHHVLAGVVLVALVAGFLLSRGAKVTPEHGHADAPSAGGSADTFVARGRAVDLTADARGRIVLDDLGLTLTVGAGLAKQGLIGVPGADPARRSTSISFATKALSRGDSACIADGARGWLGTLTRYDGPSAAMRDHSRHTIATLDYPGFHTTYRAVTQSCAARAPGTAVADLADEKLASSELWNAIRTEQPSRR